MLPPNSLRSDILIAITTRDIFQYQITAIIYLPIIDSEILCHIYLDIIYCTFYYPLSKYSRSKFRDGKIFYKYELLTDVLFKKNSNCVENL